MEIKEIEKEIEEEIEKCFSLEDIERLRIKFLGRKGVIKKIFKELKNLPFEERKEKGRVLNTLQEKITCFIKEKTEILKREKEPLHFDLFLPGRNEERGGFHPLNIALKRIEEIFVGMGFEVVEGPDIETEYYNFTALNIPEEHPARDTHATFFIQDDFLLRTHTSPVQMRIMEKRIPPVRIIAPGRVYRFDAFDASHSPCFHQVEGLYVDEGVSFAELKGVLNNFFREFFGKDIKSRFRPSYFPFTEPSAEVSISCVICKGKGCATCGTGWLEVVGCGMVHPKVLERVKYDTEKYTGYAFGFGLERLTMIKFGIPDIRMFYENEGDFLKQF